MRTPGYVRRAGSRPDRDFAAADRLLRQTARSTPRWPIALALCVLGSTAASLVLPAALAKAVDGALSAQGARACVPCFATLGVLILAEALTQLADPHATADATMFLRGRLLEHIAAIGRLPEWCAPGDLVARLTGSAAEAGAASTSVVYFAAQIVMSAGAVVALGLLYPPLALTFLLTAPACFVLVQRYLRRTTNLVVEYQQGQAAVAARLLDALTGIRTITASGTADREVERVMQPVPALSERGRALWNSQRRIAWSTSLLAPFTQLCVIAVAGYGVGTGALSTGGLVAAIGYTTTGLSFFGTAQTLLALARARAGAARIAAVLAEPVRSPGTRRLPAGLGQLELRAVRVSRAGKAILDKLDLTIPAGACIALVGNSGSGKSLLAAVAGRLTDPDEGSVLLDGAPIDEVRPEELRAAIAYAFTDPALPGETVEDVIALAPQALATQRVHDAARACQADAFIRRLPDGYLTPIAQTPLSGGERQRLGLARAIAHGGRLIILDDATSSLDTITEAVVAKALDSALDGRTRLVVTHRAAVAARADAVAWLDEGRIRAMAPHVELWQDPDYRAVFRPSQA
ncbi:ABC transporter ATP-binding protein [Actinospica robiniae]|uniref:ABC transporter ATP-binding protein n=1 Tax=Actinospica robiniae TaxID=304901 RepID=UPI000422FDA9|nr:ABC transporter ATP-binding protein [Actinospica robiniae]